MYRTFLADAQAVLQWGRGCVATEISIPTDQRSECVWASMGPWLCSHGNIVRIR